MTKAEFVESLANTLNQTKSESERALEAVVDVLKQALQRGEKIDLRCVQSARDQSLASAQPAYRRSLIDSSKEGSGL